MGMFGGSEPRITKKEFEKTRGNLRGEKFTSGQIDKVENVFNAHLDEHEKYQRGIDAEELAKGIDYIKKNKSQLGFSDKKIEALEKQLKRRL